MSSLGKLSIEDVINLSHSEHREMNLYSYCSAAHLTHALLYLYIIPIMQIHTHFEEKKLKEHVFTFFVTERIYQTMPLSF